MNLTTLGKYLSAALTAFVAVNAVLHFLPDPIVETVVTIAGVLGIAVLPSVWPAAATPPTLPPRPPTGPLARGG